MFLEIQRFYPTDEIRTSYKESLEPIKRLVGNEHVCQAHLSASNASLTLNLSCELCPKTAKGSLIGLSSGSMFGLRGGDRGWGAHRGWKPCMIGGALRAYRYQDLLVSFLNA